MSNYTDERILTVAIKSGDIEAFEFLYKTYHPRLRNYVSHFITDEDAILDIIQEGFLYLWENHATIILNKVTSLIFTIVRNRTLNYLKHQVIMQRHRSEIMGSDKGEERLYHLDFTNTPEEILMHEELKVLIDNIIDSLPPRTKEVFVMSRFEGKKNREIAEELGITVKVVEKHITKALKAFSYEISKSHDSIMHSMLLLATCELCTTLV